MTAETCQRPGLVEGQTLEHDITLDVDICIVGSGAGGAIAAAQLAKAGLRVVVLEEGGYFTSDRFTMTEEDCYPNLYQESAQRTTADLSVAIFQGKAVGGTTVVNWTTCFRTPEYTLNNWRHHHAVSGLSGEILAPHYEAVESRLSIRKIALEHVNRNNRLLWDGCQTLGYQVDTLHRNVIGCALTGYCGMGCPVDLKQSMHLTYLPDAMSEGATVISRCQVQRLKWNKDRVVEATAEFLDAFGLQPTGVQITVRANKFVVSCGAINSPALLMRSEVPDPYGRLGRRTFLHPVIVSCGEYEDPVEGYYGAPQGVASHSFAERGQEVGFFLEAAPVYPVLLATACPLFGWEHRALMERLPYLAGHIGLAIDGHHEGEEGGTVKLMPSGRPQLDYTPSRAVLSALREAQKTLAQIQLASGAKRVMSLHNSPVYMTSVKDIQKLDEAPFVPNQLAVFSAHQMGGCAMSDEPQRGVVRASDLGHHQLSNLYVMDGSVFPTSCGVNPQLSIFGLVHHMAEKLAHA